MSISPLTFTGISQFSDDFQVIVDRAVAIASLPVQDMQYEQVDLLAKKQLLSDLRTSVAGVATAVDALGTLGGSKALGATTTNSNRVTVTMNGADQAGTYTISEITSIALAASENTAIGYADSDTETVSTDGLMELVLGSSTYEIDLTGDGENNLEGLRDAINNLGAGVTATIINTGTGDTPYYLSITAASSGAQTLQLRETAGEEGTNALTADNQGSNAVFKLNGLTITKSDNMVTDVIDGLTFTIKSETSDGETVDIKLSSSRGAVISGISTMVSAYNSLRTQVNAQIGEAAGLLSGDHIVRVIKSRMRDLSAYTGSGDIQSLAELGIEFDEQGEMSFDSAALYSLSDANFSEVLDFLGDSTSGMGELAGKFEQISDSVTGMIVTQQNQYDTAYDRLTDQITKASARIDLMQSTLSAQLQFADALLAQLESEQTLLEASIESLNFTTYGKQNA